MFVVGLCVCYCVRERVGLCFFFFFFQAEDGIRDIGVTGVQTCALPILYTNQNLQMQMHLAHYCIFCIYKDSVSIAARVTEIIWYRFVFCRSRENLGLGPGKINSLPWRICYQQSVSTVFKDTFLNIFILVFNCPDNEI